MNENNATNDASNRPLRDMAIAANNLGWTLQINGDIKQIEVRASVGTSLQSPASAAVTSRYIRNDCIETTYSINHKAKVTPSLHLLAHITTETGTPAPVPTSQNLLRCLAFLDAFRLTFTESDEHYHISTTIHPDHPWMDYAWIFLPKSKVNINLATLSISTQSANGKEKAEWTTVASAPKKWKTFTDNFLTQLTLLSEEPPF